MISAAGVPVIETEVDALSVHAASLIAAGGAYTTAGADFHATWQGMAAYYRAPEADYLFASTGPIRDTTRSVGEDVGTVGSALLAYAEEVREIQTRLDGLRTAAAEFEMFVAGRPDWSAIPANVDRSNALLAKVSAAVLDFEDAQRRCANAIAALSGRSASRISDGDGVAEAGEFGSTAGELDMRAGTGQGVPWGRTVELDDDAVDDGNWLAELGHTALDGIGLIPGLGELADGTNAAWYAAEGDQVNAGLSAAGMVPFVGWAATSGKLARRVRQADHDPPGIGTLVTTPRGTTFDIPGGWTSRPADNGKGIVWQRPGATGNADSIRLMEPTSRYPNGYFRHYNSQGQPLDIHGRPGPNSATHIPEDFRGMIEGWPK